MEQLYRLGVQPSLWTGRNQSCILDVRRGRLLSPSQSVRRNVVFKCALVQSPVRSGLVSTKKAIDEILQVLGSVKVGGGFLTWAAMNLL